MATFYVDFENGNDANDGLSFANRWKTFTNGATAARIAPGDTIRVMASPDPTDTGVTGAWTSEKLAGTFSVGSSTNASPISIATNGATSHGYTTGDTVVITGHTTNTHANGTWEITVTSASTFTLNGSTGNGIGGVSGSVRKRNNTVVRLSTPLTQTIASTGNRGEGRTEWVASANVTVDFSTADFKEGDVADRILPLAGFTTGLAAYKATGLLDLSSYQQVSFWVKQTAGTTAVAGDLSLRLCSDTAGVTTVHTIAIPALAASGRWAPITVDLGAAMSASIQSIALYVDVDRGTQTILLSNIVACKAPSDAASLNLQSLISKNTAGEFWWCLQSINGTRVMLDVDVNGLPNSVNTRGYYGTTSTGALYKRETIKLALASTDGGENGTTIQDSGTSGSPISYSGGWDRTAMTSQTSTTWLDSVNGRGAGFKAASRNWLVFDALNMVRSFNAHTFDNGNNLQLTNCAAASTTSTMAGFAGGGVNSIQNYASVAGGNVAMSFTSGGTWTINAIALICPAAGGLSLTNSSNFAIADVTVTNTPGNPIALSSAMQNTFSDIAIWGCAAALLFSSSAQNIFRRLSITSDSFATGIQLSGGHNHLVDSVIDVATEVTPLSGYVNTHVTSHNHDNTAGNHVIFHEGGRITAQTSVVNTPGGVAWAIAPTSTVRNSAYPLTLSLAKIAVGASTLVTVKAWMRRTNTGLTMRLVCKGGQIGGVPSDVVASMTAIADTWEELTITFTPSEVGVVEIIAEAYGGSTYTGYIDDMTISQA